MLSSPPLYGLLAEFPNAQALVAATRLARAAGYRRMDAFSPFPVEGLAEALEFRQTWIPLVVLLGGVGGAVAGYAMQYYISVIDYPLNIGGRPLHSWPAFIPVTFETAVLGAAVAAVLGVLALNGLPQPYHPLFNVERFLHVTQDGFFLAIEAADPLFDPARTRDFLLGLGAREVSDVPE